MLKSYKDNSYIIKLFYICILIILIIFFSILKNVIIENDENKIINIEVKGEVKNPGIFKMSLGSTVNDLFSLLIFNDDVDLSVFNLNNKLANNQVIIIKKKDNNLISINTASKEELMKLKGIGEELALRIIDYREKNNGYKSLEDLLNVKGIGEKKFAAIKEYITL